MSKVVVSLAQRRRLRRVALHLFIKMIEFLNFRHFSSFLILDHLLLPDPSNKFFQVSPISFE